MWTDRLIAYYAIIHIQSRYFIAPSKLLFFPF